jgi:uncharacterized phage protein gp47/JayE
MAGLSSTGITIKDVAEILSDIESEQLTNIDADLSVGPDDVLGQLNGIYAASLAELWELLEEVYQSAYPDTASGQSLSYVSALTGAIRLAATKASLFVYIEGTVGTTVPAGTQVYPDGDPDSLFVITADVVIAEHGTPDWVETTMEAVTAGTATTAAAGDILIIATPVAGVNSFDPSGSTPFTPGTDEETDSELRIRRENTLALAGASTVDAIRAEMLNVPGVDICTVFENPTGITDPIGIPPYAIEVLVSNETGTPYTQPDVVAEILLRKPAGTATYGGIGPTTATDSAGNDYDIYYSEPVDVRAYVAVTLTAETDGTYVGDEPVQKAIAEWATRSLLVGQDLFSSDIVNVVADLEGVVSVDVTATFVDDDATPSPNTVLVITARQLATILYTDVVVTS